MSRAQTIALVDRVLYLCGVGNAAGFAELVSHEDGKRHFVEMCCAAAAQPPPPPVNMAPVVNVALQVVVPPPPPPPPPVTVSVALQVDVPAVLTATVGTQTNSCRGRNAQSQTAQWMYGNTIAVQTNTTLGMVDESTTTEGTIGISMVDASTDNFLDRVWLGLEHSAAQTEVAGPVVPLTDFEQLGAELAAVVEAASAERAAAEDGAQPAPADKVVQTEESLRARA
jgi:hypothetical protein